jgi:dTDP-glucose pyrophosphorylase
MKSVILAGGLGTRIFEETYLKPKIAQITIMATLASGVLTILFVFIRSAFRNLKGDAESSQKLVRIRRGIGLKSLIGK